MFAYLQTAGPNPDINPLTVAPNYVESGNNQYVICKKV
jgi:hypothetical protein